MDRRVLMYLISAHPAKHQTPCAPPRISGQASRSASIHHVIIRAVELSEPSSSDAATTVEPSCFQTTDWLPWISGYKDLDRSEIPVNESQAVRRVCISATWIDESDRMTYLFKDGWNVASEGPTIYQVKVLAQISISFLSLTFHM